MMFNKEQGADLFLSMLKNKEVILKEILNDLSQCRRSYVGLDNIIEKIDSADEINLRHYLKTSVKVLKKQSDILTRLVLLALVYTQGDTFTSDVSNALVKLGRGNDALQEIFRQKMEE